MDLPVLCLCGRVLCPVPGVLVGVFDVSERLERSMYSFVFRYSGRQQLYILMFVVMSWPIGFMLLDLPKQIINRALGAAQETYSIAVLGLAEVPFAVSQTTFLVILCLLFLSLVILNNGLKFHINTMKGRIAERLLRRLRYSLFSRVLRFPIPHFKRTSQGEIISMITAEAEPIGAFFVGAVVDPIFQGGLLLVALGFIIVVQDPMLGVAAAAFYPLQIYVVPRLQKEGQRARQGPAAPDPAPCPTMSAKTVGGASSTFTPTTPPTWSCPASLIVWARSTTSASRFFSGST